MIATLFGVPVEEFAFFVLQPILTGLMLMAVLEGGATPSPKDAQAPPTQLTLRLVGTAGALVVAVAGAWFLTSPAMRYMGLILLWAFPVLAFLWGYGGHELWQRRSRLIPVIGVSTVYLWIADRVAIELEIWTISSTYTTGWTLLGLPIEEAAFFLVTNLMVAFGLTLFLVGTSQAASTRGAPVRRISMSELRRLRDEPHEVLLDIAREGGDVVPLGVGPLRAFLLARPDAIRHVLRDRWKDYEKSTFQYRLLSGVTGQGLLTMDGPAWLNRRRTAQPAFHKKRVEGLVSEMRSAALRTAGEWEGVAERGGTIDVVHDMSRLAIDVLGTTLLGPAAGSPERRDELVHATETVLEHVMDRSRSLGVVPDFLPTRGNARYMAALDSLDRAVLEAIHAAREGQPTGALLEMLADGGSHAAGLTDAELRNEIVTFFIAGHETVASALTWTWYLLATNRPEAQRVEAETGAAGTHVAVGQPAGTARGCPVSAGAADSCDDAPPCSHASSPYLHAVFQEALRLYPPAWVITRRSKVDDEIAGVRIPRGSLVIASPYATHRLTDVWKDPDRFDPERFTIDEDAAGAPFAYFPFGGGPHLCIGSHFALIEGAAALEVLASRFHLELAGGEPEMEPGVTLRPKGGLRMRPMLLGGSTAGLETRVVVRSL